VELPQLDSFGQQRGPSPGTEAARVA
jgi:hypothetical protein